jgi:hypothetical protein
MKVLALHGNRYDNNYYFLILGFRRKGLLNQVNLVQNLDFLVEEFFPQKFKTALVRVKVPIFYSHFGEVLSTQKRLSVIRRQMQKDN